MIASLFSCFSGLALSDDQKAILERVSVFLDNADHIFMLKGYAGTGKTTLIQGLIKHLNSEKKQFEVMAPTGRAAKVLRDKTGYGKTIHSCIYDFENLISINKESEDEADHSFHYIFPIKHIHFDGEIIIVDEASMISSKESKNELFTFGTNILLNDLLTYSRLPNSKTKIVFVGDPAQLPPVGDNHSWALDKSYFDKLGLSSEETEMKEVVRQKDNLILKNATLLRNTLKTPNRDELKFEFDKNTFVEIEGDEIIKEYTDIFPSPEIGNGVVISYSNSQCFHYNNAIREKIFSNQREIVPGDLLLINNNNYHTYGVELFNGDIVKVISVSPFRQSQSAPVWCTEAGRKVRKIIKLDFREVIIRHPGYPQDISCLIIDSLLHSIDRDLSVDEMKALYINFVMRFNEEQKKKKENNLEVYKVGSFEFKAQLKHDRFFNALRVKFGYAITCHKAQGGEWDKISVDYSGRVSLKDDPLRWCYTATTRGKNTLYAINPPHFGKLNKFKFAPIGLIGKIPADSLRFDQVNVSPFHTPNQHRCKSAKYWEIVEKLEDTPYVIESVESKGDFLERYTIRNGDITIVIQASHKGSGHFIEKFRVTNTIDETIKEEIESIFNSPFICTFNLDYKPGSAMLADLFSKMQEQCSDLKITITNIVEKPKDYFVNYYLITDSPCAYIQFYFDIHNKLTTAIPKTYQCANDSKLQLLIQNLLNYAQ